VDVNSITATKIVVDVEVDAGAAVGARDVTVTLPGNKSHISATKSAGFFVKGKAPILSSVSPSTADRGATLDLTVTGDNFDVTTPGNMSATLTRSGVTASGEVDGTKVMKNMDIIDQYDRENNITAMTRTTAFPTSIIAQMVIDGSIPERGVKTPEMCVPGERFLKELADRDIVVREY